MRDLLGGLDYVRASLLVGQHLERDRRPLALHLHGRLLDSELFAGHHGT